MIVEMGGVIGPVDGMKADGGEPEPTGSVIPPIGIEHPPATHVHIPLGADMGVGGAEGAPDDPPTDGGGGHRAGEESPEEGFAGGHHRLRRKAR